MSRKADIKASLRGIARALHNFMGTGSEERLPEKLVTLSERLTKSSHQDDPRIEPAIGRVQMSQKLAKSAAELESMIMAELREHPECDSAAVEVTSKEIGFWCVRGPNSMTPARRCSWKSLSGFDGSSILAHNRVPTVGGRPQ